MQSNSVIKGRRSSSLLFVVFYLGQNLFGNSDVSWCSEKAWWSAAKREIFVSVTVSAWPVTVTVM